MPETLGVLVMWVAVASVAVPVVVILAALVLIALVLKLVVTAVWNLLDPPSARELRRVDHDRDEAVRELVEIRRRAVRRMREIADEDVFEGRLR